MVVDTCKLTELTVNTMTMAVFKQKLRLDIATQAVHDCVPVLCALTSARVTSLDEPATVSRSLDKVKTSMKCSASSQYPSSNAGDPKKLTFTLSTASAVAVAKMTQDRNNCVMRSCIKL